MTPVNNRCLRANLSLVALTLCLIIVPANPANSQFSTANKKNCATLKTALTPNDVGASVLLAAAVVKSPKFLASRRSTAKRLTGGPKFGEAVEVHQEYNDGYYLVKVPNTDVCGFMRGEEIILNRKPMSDSGDPLNPSYVKAVLTTDWKTSKDTKSKIIEMRNGPGPDYDVIHQESIFHFFYKYADTESPENQSENALNFALIGRFDGWNANNSKRNFVGWVDKNSIIEWTSRVAAYPNPITWKDRKAEKRPIRYFIDNATAVEGAKHGVMHTEPMDRPPENPVPHYLHRWPVISQDDVLTTLAYVGSGFDAKTLKQIGDKRFAHLVDEGNRFTIEIKKKDILFLIDGTSSIAGYFNSVISAVDQFVGSQPDNEKEFNRFAVALYRDIKDTPNFRQVVDFTSSFPTFRAKLRKATAGSEIKAVPEAVFNGILQSAKAPKKGGQFTWREHSTKSIILIGDHGNVPDDRLLTQVSSSLYDANIEFYCINILTIAGYRSHNEAFINQCNRINSLRGQRSKRDFGPKAPDTLGASFPPGIEAIASLNKTQVKQTILSSLGDIVTLTNQRLNTATDFLEGEVVKNQSGEIDFKGTFEHLGRGHGARPTLFFLNSLKRFPNFQSIRRRLLEQGVHKGYVKRRDKPWSHLLKPYVLITAGEIEDLRGYLSRIVKDLRTTGDGLRVGNSIQEMVRHLSGDNFNPGDNPAKWLQRRFHIPFRKIGKQGKSKERQDEPLAFDRQQESLLAMNKNQILTLFNATDKNSVKKRQELSKRLITSFEQLRMVLQEQNRELKNWDPATLRYASTPSRKRKWFRIPPDSDDLSKYAWVPLEYFP